MLRRFHIEVLDKFWCDFSHMIIDRLRRRVPAVWSGCDEYGDPVAQVQWATLRQDLVDFTARHTGLVLRVTMDDEVVGYAAGGAFTDVMP